MGRCAIVSMGRVGTGGYGVFMRIVSLRFRSRARRAWRGWEIVRRGWVRCGVWRWWVEDARATACLPRESCIEGDAESTTSNRFSSTHAGTGSGFITMKRVGDAATSSEKGFKSGRGVAHRLRKFCACRELGVICASLRVRGLPSREEFTLLSFSKLVGEVGRLSGLAACLCELGTR